MNNTLPNPQEVAPRRRRHAPILISLVLALLLSTSPYGLFEGVGRAATSAIGGNPAFKSATPRSAHATTTSSIPQGVPANAVAARVTRIVDGDTIRVRINGVTYKVRYIGMDTPERGDPCYKAASDLNAAYVANQTVYLEKDVSEVDRYGRLLRYIWTADGVLVNVALVRQGYALAYTWPPDVKYETEILAAQRAARNNNAGCIWGN